MTSPSAVLPWNPPRALAPLEGVGSPAVLAALARVGGMGLVCAPFLRATDLHPPSADLVRRLSQRYGPMAHSAQVLGTAPLPMAAAARAFQDAGVDIVDLNFGCPSRLVTRKGGGAALLARPEDIRRIVAAVRAAVRIPVSAKIRLGRTDPADCLGLARAAADGGADILVVHARTLADGYRGPARWEWLARIVAASSLPVVGNGDVFEAADALRMVRETGVAGVMCGRGALRNPWLFRQIEAMEVGRTPVVPSLADISQYLLDLATALAAECVNDRQCEGRMKEVVAHMGTLIADHGVFRREVLRSQGIAAVLAVIRALPDRPDARVRLSPVPLAEDQETRCGHDT